VKLAIFFDIFNEKGGAERVAIMLANYFNADIYTTYVDWNNVDKELKKLKVHEIGLTFKDAKLLTYSEIAWRFSKLKLPKYDAYLFLRLYCSSASKKFRPSIWISTGILRSVYDLHDYFYEKISLWQKPIFKIWCWFFRYFDQKWIKGFDKILTNSKFTTKRIKKYYGKKSIVAYHPVETKRFFCKDYENFYLSSARLVKEKQVDLIIKAFKEMPDKKLIIVGDGPEREKLEKLAKNCKNIEFLGAVDFKKIIDLYSICTATIVMCLAEDWGLIPIESMAAGKPCIAANDGGYKESIVHGKTGYLIEPTVKEIKKYVNILTPQNARKMKRDCIRRAKIFDIEIFVKKVEEELKIII